MVRAVPAGRAVVTTENKDNTAKGRKQLLANYKSMTAKIGKLSKQAALGASAIAAPLALAVKKFTEQGDKIDKMAKRTGLATDDVQSLAFALEQSGSSIEAIEPAFKALNRNLLDMSRDTATAKDNFADLGIDFESFMKLSPADRFREIAKQLKTIPDAGMRSALAVKFLGRSGADVLPLLGDLENLESEFKDMGTAMSEEQVAAAAKLNDEMNKLNHQFKQVVVEVGGALAPAIMELAKDMQPAIKQVVEWIRNNPNLIKGIGMLVPALGGLSLALKAINIIMMANPFMLMVVGLTAAIPLVDQLNKRLGNTKEELAGIGGAFGPAEKDVIGARGQAGNARKQFEESKKFIKAANQRRLQDPREQARLQQVFFKNLNHVAKRFKEVGDTMQKGIDKAESAKAFETASSQATSMAKDAVGRFGEVFKRGIGAAGTAIGLAAEFGQGQQLANQATQTISGGLGASALGIVRQQGARQMDQLVESNQRQEELSRRLLDEISGMRDELG